MLRHVVDIDTQFRQSLQHPAGFLDILFEPGFRLSVFAVGIQSFHRRRVHRIRSDEGLDVLHVPEVWVLGAGAGPEQPLNTSALRSQLPKPVAAEGFFVDLIRHLRAADGNLPVHLLRGLRLFTTLRDEFFQQRIHQRINAAYKEASHRG